MRSVALSVVSAVAFLSLAGCNSGQPRIYKVAIDRKPLRTITTPTCYRNSALPSSQGQYNEENFRAEDDWTIWGGEGQTEYLDMGTESFQLGSAPEIEVDASTVIQGTDKNFAANRSVQRPIASLYTEVRQTQIAVKFDNYSASPTGTIQLTSQYACIPGTMACPVGEASPPDAASCTATLTFVARKIDAQQVTFYSNDPQ